MKIGYWAIRGRAQPVKNLAYYLGIKYENVLYQNPDDWFKKDKQELGIPFPNLPYIIDEKVKLTETTAIMKYLCIKGHKEEMLGKVPMDQVYMEQFQGVLLDQAIAIYPLVFRTDETAAYEKVFNQTFYPKMDEMNKFLEKKKFITGDYLTWIDFVSAEFMEFIQAVSLATIKVNLFEKYPNLSKYFNNFMEVPQVKEFSGKEENQIPFLPPHILKIKL